MPQANECSVLFGPTKIIFKSEPSLNAIEDPFEKDGLRVQIHVSKIFHKMLNFISEEKELFQKEDYTLLGEMLGKIIFGGNNAQYFLNTIILRVNEPDCTRLYFDFTNNPELSELPWEYIYVPLPERSIVKTDDKNIYLAANKGNIVQLIRRMDFHDTAPPTAEKLNVVLIVSNGSNRSKGIIERDPTHLINVFDDLKTRYAGTFDYRVVENPTLDDFKAKLITTLREFEPGENGSFPPYLVHYFGHSRVRGKEGELVLNTPLDGMDWIKDDDFAALFDKDFLSVNLERNNGRRSSINPAPPLAVFLQACDSGKIANMKEGKGVAVAMCRRNIPAVIGMQNEIDVQSSSRFSQVFYESLLHGEDVATAVTKGRYFLGHENDILREKDIFGNNSFGSPVLFITTKEPVILLKKPYEEEIIEYTEVRTVRVKKCLNPRCGKLNEVSAESCVECKTSFLRTKAESARAGQSADQGSALQPKSTEAYEHR